MSEGSPDTGVVEGAGLDALPDNACGVMGLCELLKGHEGKHTTSVDRALEGVVLPYADIAGLRARIRQVVERFGGGAISDEDADAAAGVLYGTPLAAFPGAFEWDDCAGLEGAGLDDEEPARGDVLRLGLNAEQTAILSSLLAHRQQTVSEWISDVMFEYGLGRPTRKDYPPPSSTARLATPAPAEVPE